jgi:hypothetical protein
MGLGDKEQRELELFLLDHPKAGDVIPGTGSARKLRREYAGHGKRGGARVIYVDFVVYDKIVLLAAYPKGVKDDLTSTEKKAVAAQVGKLREELE